MLYLIKFHVDHQALGFGPQRTEIAAAEARRAADVQAAGQLIGLWRRADTGGAVFVVDCASHEQLSELLSSLPLFPYVRSIEVTPLIPHPSFPEYAKPALRAGLSQQASHDPP